jgi:hypothetical protein
VGYDIRQGSITIEEKNTEGIIKISKANQRIGTSIIHGISLKVGGFFTKVVAAKILLHLLLSRCNPRWWYSKVRPDA